MELARLSDFQAVALEGSFSKAAKRLYKTQPAVSQAVRLLEDEVGERLFVRLGRTIELTQAGEVLLEHTRRAFHELNEGTARIEGLRELETGVLTVGTSDTTACYILPPALRKFRSLYPGVEIILSNRTSPVTLKQVLSHDVEVGLVTLPCQHPRIAVKELAAREDVIICPPDHPLAGRKRVKTAELAHYPLLLLDTGSSTRAFIESEFARAGVTPEIAMELGSIEVIKKMVQLGFGVSVVPRVAVEDEIERGLVAAVGTFGARRVRKLGVIHLKRKYLSPAAREFLHVLHVTIR